MVQASSASTLKDMVAIPKFEGRYMNQESADTWTRSLVAMDIINVDESGRWFVPPNRQAPSVARDIVASMKEWPHDAQKRVIDKMAGDLSTDRLNDLRQAMMHELMRAVPRPLGDAITRAMKPKKKSGEPPADFLKRVARSFDKLKDIVSLKARQQLHVGALLGVTPHEVRHSEQVGHVADSKDPEEVATAIKLACKAVDAKNGKGYTMRMTWSAGASRTRDNVGVAVIDEYGDEFDDDAEYDYYDAEQVAAIDHRERRAGRGPPPRGARREGPTPRGTRFSCYFCGEPHRVINCREMKIAGQKYQEARKRGTFRK